MADVKKYNKLIHEKSPYLLQHVHNPVEWYPWGEEAIEKARRENKVIFLSIGYSTCHWCHVMAHESFEDDQTAKIMNEKYVNIKVDREERPDIDKVYMKFIVSMNGSGGWPMSVFLDPHSLGPFTGGTYFPPVPKFGSPSFSQVLNKIAELWETDRDAIMRNSEDVIQALNRDQLAGDQSFDPDRSILRHMFSNISKMYDSEEGGFSRSPKFPTPTMITGLLNYYREFSDRQALDMTAFTLRKMAEGGIYDQLGGGFHRYSVTRDWLVPHFEKMLYDQAQLIVVFLETYQLTKESFFADIAKETIDYVLNDMRDKKNGIYSAEDADSPLPEDPSKKGEGAFYTWTKKELSDLLDPMDVDILCLRYGVNDHGNVHPEDDPHHEFRNKNILHIVMAIEDIAKQMGMSVKDTELSLDRSRQTLLKKRSQRPKPHLDDKIITEWNAYMITALTRAYQVLDDVRYLDAAKGIVQFIKEEMYDKESNTLFRTYREGRSDIEGFATDYAAMIASLIDVYESDFDVENLKWAVKLQQRMLEKFYDFENGGFYHTKPSDEQIITKMKDYSDNTVPSENSLGVTNLLKLHQMTNNSDYLSDAMKTFQYFSSVLETAPVIAPCLSSAIRLYTRKTQIIISGEKHQADTQALIKTVHSVYEPAKVILLDDKTNRKAFEEWEYPMFTTDDLKIDGKATAYVCKDFTCQMPVTTKEELLKLLEK